MVNIAGNARFLETDRRIEIAAITLMDTKKRASTPLSIAAICREAGINRSTFYEHFDSIDDVIAVMQEHLLAELVENFKTSQDNQQAPAESSPAEIPLSRASFELFLRHIREHRYFYGIALHSGHGLPVHYGSQELWEQRIRPVCASIGIDDEDDMKYFLDCTTASVSAILRRWIDRDCRDSVEKVALIAANAVPAILATDAEIRAFGDSTKH